MATHWFDSGEGVAGGDPYGVTVRFTGRRTGTRGNPRPGESFIKDEVIEGIVPGTGPVSITTTVSGVLAGDWTVDAELVADSRTAGPFALAPRARGSSGRQVRPAAWSWRRWAISTRPEQPIPTRWALLAPLAMQPAVMPGIYTALGIFAIVFALVVQAAILGRGDVPFGPTLGASGIAILFGLFGAKVWYATLHPGESIIRGGWAVDGFLIVFPVVAAVALLLFELPIGVVLDASTPGVFFAVAIGRVGCFFTGCCAGRCTASRWGMWSSDRRVGARRLPTQLFESGAGLVIGLVALVLVLGGMSPLSGVIFVTAFSVYAIVRQVLLRLRVEQRRDARTVPMTGVASGVVTFAVIVLSVAQGP
ncbi:MAG: prolipoprotein diacylglyceryl transferase family protein [Chloroflexota bacterium]